MNEAQFRQEMFLFADESRVVVERLAAPVCQRRGITAQQLHALVELKREPDMSIGQLAQRIGLLKTNISPLCRKLEERGFVERHRDANDGRSFRLRLTQAGTDLLDDIDQEVRESCEGVFASEPPETFDTIVRGLQAFRGLAAKLEA